MKKRLLITGLVLVSAISFGQKREIRKAEKAIESNQFNEALDYLNQAESSIATVDNSVKAQYYAAKGEALLGIAGNDFAKLKGSASAFTEAMKLDPSIESQLSVPLQNLRAGLINSAIQDQNAEQYKMASDKLHLSYTLSKEPSDLYFAAGNAVNGKDYDTALKYYQMLLDMGFTGETKEFVATNKETGEVESFESENVRNLAIKSGQYIKPEVQVGESKKGEILRNMTLIYLEQGDTEKATNLMKAARSENPNDTYLMRAEADMMYKMGNVERYNEIMNEIVASDPNNPEIYFNLGVGSAEIGDKDKAIGYYEKALELQPDYEAALINIAVLKLSQEDKLVEEMNSLGNSRADNQRYEELKQMRKNIYIETLPYLEKALALKPNNPEVLRTMMNIYGQLGEEAKFKEMKAKLDATEKQ